MGLVLRDCWRAKWAGAVAVASAMLVAGCTADRMQWAPPALADADWKAAPTLGIGDPAPPLAVSEWVRGQPVDAFQPGHIYVLDHWAVWCGPCLASFQHTSDLQDRYQGAVTVIALTTEDQANTAARIRRHARRSAGTMRFAVAIDDGTKTAERYRLAAQYAPLPATFIINRDGRIAWIGNPMRMEPVLEAIVADTWDIAAAASTFREDMEEQATAARLNEALAAAREQNDVDAQIAALRQLVQLHPRNLRASPSHWAVVRLADLLAAQGEMDQARAVLETALVEPAFAGEKYVPPEPAFVADIARAMLPLSPARAEELANAALRDLAEQERAAAEPPRDDWDDFLRLPYQWRRGMAYAALAELRFNQGRHAEAVDLQRMSLARFDPRFGEYEWGERRLRKYEAALTD